MIRLIHALIKHDKTKSVFFSIMIYWEGAWQLKIKVQWKLALILFGICWQKNGSGFENSINLSFGLASHMQKVTWEKVEERWQAMILQLRCGISNWECSRQGDSGFINELDAKEGALDDQKNII